MAGIEDIIIPSTASFFYSVWRVLVTLASSTKIQVYHLWLGVSYDFSVFTIHPRFFAVPAKNSRLSRYGIMPMPCCLRPFSASAIIFDKILGTEEMPKGKRCVLQMQGGHWPLDREPWVSLMTFLYGYIQVCILQVYCGHAYLCSSVERLKSPGMTKRAPFPACFLLGGNPLFFAAVLSRTVYRSGPNRKFPVNGIPHSLFLEAMSPPMTFRHRALFPMAVALEDIIPFQLRHLLEKLPL
ncbi:hypothetical protein AB205_0138630, partial [Aquarana catesbeiana]